MLQAELLGCRDDLKDKISFIFDERHGVLRNARGQPSCSIERAFKRAWLRRAHCTFMYGLGPSLRKRASLEEK